MADAIPWSSPAENGHGPCGTLRDAVVRWKEMASQDDEAILGITVASPVYLEGWAEPRTVRSQRR